MQTKRENRQGRLVLLPPVEQFVPSDHRLRRLNRVLDLSFVHEAVRGKYCQDNGRPSIDPEVVLRLFLLQAIEGIGQVRELLRQVQVNLAYRWFIGYELDEEIPDHSTLSRALDRFGDEVFNEVFVRSIAQCLKSGLIEGKVLHVDATTIRADINKTKTNKPESSDPDARFGHFPDGTLKPGYKQQTVVDDASRVIVGVGVMPANRNDHEGVAEVIDAAIDHAGRLPEAVCADAAYGTGATCATMEDRGVRLVSPPQRPGQRLRPGMFSNEDFAYDERTDSFVCPAGRQLRRVCNESARPSQARYRIRGSDCRACLLKEQCTPSARKQLKVSAHYGSLQQLRRDSATESFRALYRRRAPVIEGVFAEAKQWHGLRRAWRRGLFKMKVQCLLVAAVLNFKRLAASFPSFFGSRAIFNAVIAALGRILNIIRRIDRDTLNICHPMHA